MLSKLVICTYPLISLIFLFFTPWGASEIFFLLLLNFLSKFHVETAWFFSYNFFSVCEAEYEHCGDWVNWWHRGGKLKPECSNWTWGAIILHIMMHLTIIINPSCHKHSNQQCHLCTCTSVFVAVLKCNNYYINTSQLKYKYQYALCLSSSCLKTDRQHWGMIQSHLFRTFNRWTGDIIMIGYKRGILIRHIQVWAKVHHLVNRDFIMLVQGNFVKTYDKFIIEPKFMFVFCYKVVCVSLNQSRKNKSCRTHWKWRLPWHSCIIQVYGNFWPWPYVCWGT